MDSQILERLEALEKNVAKIQRHLFGAPKEYPLLPPVRPHKRVGIFHQIKPYLALPRYDVIEWVNRYETDSDESEWSDEYDPMTRETANLYDILIEFSKNPLPETISFFTYVMRSRLESPCMRNQIPLYLCHVIWENLSHHPTSEAIDLFRIYPNRVNWRRVRDSNQDPDVPMLCDKYIPIMDEWMIKPLPPMANTADEREDAYCYIHPYLFLPRQDVLDWINHVFEHSTELEWENIPVQGINENSNPCIHLLLLNLSRHPLPSVFTLFEKYMPQIIAHVRLISPRDDRRIWSNLATHPNQDAADAFFAQHPDLFVPS